ncbi:MAG: restriction endonuclease [Flavobacteriales bacterium]|nr:restriction endonuclease [Flavobacteriales bacterium]
MSSEKQPFPPTWMVRAMASQEADFKVFFDGSVVALGWSRVNFTDYLDRVDELIERVTKDYAYDAPDLWAPSVGRQLNQIRRFMAFAPGDRVVVPYYDGVCLATVTGPRRYSEAAKHTDLCNQIAVDYQLDPSTGQPRVIPRNALSEALQRRLRVRGSTLSDLSEFSEEVDRMFHDLEYSWTSQQAKREESVRQEFRDELLSRLQVGTTNLRTGGIGLEHLIKELFTLEGYAARVLDKRRFKNGDADVEAEKSDMFNRNRILAQVKHHAGVTNGWGLEQLVDIQTSGTESDALLVLITSAVIPEEVKANADLKGIQTMDGKALCEWVMTHIHRLKPETAAQLGISTVPRFVVTS